MATEFVIGTNESHPEMTSFQGTYAQAENASPFEVFLAETAETAVSYEMKKYAAAETGGSF